MVLKTNFRSFFEWPFYTGFTVCPSTLDTEGTNEVSLKSGQ